MKEAEEGGAATPLLETKLRAPRRRRGVVHRPRLNGRLFGRDRPALVLVSAPAGFGKTTQLVEWFVDAAGEGHSTAWLSLDFSDNDPALFWSYVVAAVRTVAPEVGATALSLLRSSQALESVVVSLLNDMAALTDEVVLVLDDYHVIESAELHESMAYLVGHLPPQVRLVLASRADPPWPLARMRARGELLEIRASDLRFTADEATTYFKEAMGLDLTAGDVGALEGRTEGWIAALQLAALSMQGRDDVARFIESFTGGDRFVVDYLAEEVLERQSEDVRSFLLQTAILHRLTGALCDAVTGGRGGKATLEMLAPYGSLSPNGRHRPSGLSALERTPARPDRWPGRHPHLPLTFGGDDGGMGPRVLLAEDDRAIRESLVLALELEGHEVEAVTDGGHALESIMAREPDLIVLDWMMPGVDGLSVCRRVRSGGSAVPILMLTARTEISDRVSGLDAGADDYLAKPFSLDELLARVRALIRRSGSEASDRRIRVADLLVDPAARRAWRGPRELQLTRTEFDLLLTFVRNAGAVCTHSAIYSSAWNYDFGPDSKTLAVYVGYLRRKLEEGGERRLIHTVRGVGYTLRAP